MHSSNMVNLEQGPELIRERNKFGSIDDKTVVLKKEKRKKKKYENLKNF